MHLSICQAIHLLSSNLSIYPCTNIHTITTHTRHRHYTRTWYTHHTSRHLSLPDLSCFLALHLRANRQQYTRPPLFPSLSPLPLVSSNVSLSANVCLPVNPTPTSVPLLSAQYTTVLLYTTAHYSKSWYTSPSHTNSQYGGTLITLQHCSTAHHTQHRIYKYAESPPVLYKAHRCVRTKLSIPTLLSPLLLSSPTDSLFLSSTKSTNPSHILITSCLHVTVSATI